MNNLNKKMFFLLITLCSLLIISLKPTDDVEENINEEGVEQLALVVPHPARFLSLLDDHYFFLDFLLFLTDEEIDALAETCSKTHLAIRCAYKDPIWALAFHQMILDRYNPINQPFFQEEKELSQKKNTALQIAVRDIHPCPYLGWLLSYPGINDNLPELKVIKAILYAIPNICAMRSLTHQT